MSLFYWSFKYPEKVFPPRHNSKRGNFKYVESFVLASESTEDAVDAIDLKLSRQGLAIEEDKIKALTRYCFADVQSLLAAGIWRIDENKKIKFGDFTVSEIVEVFDFTRRLLDVAQSELAEKIALCAKVVPSTPERLESCEAFPLTVSQIDRNEILSTTFPF